MVSSLAFSVAVSLLRDSIPQHVKGFNPGVISKVG